MSYKHKQPLFKGAGLIMWHEFDNESAKILIGQETVYLHEQLGRFQSKLKPTKQNVQAMETFMNNPNTKNPKTPAEFYKSNAVKYSELIGEPVYYNKPEEKTPGKYKTNYRIIGNKNVYGIVKGGSNKNFQEIPVDIMKREFAEEVGPFIFDDMRLVYYPDNRANTYQAYTYKLETKEELKMINQYIKNVEESRQGELVNLQWRSIKDVYEMVYTANNVDKLNPRSNQMLETWFNAIFGYDEIPADEYYDETGNYYQNGTIYYNQP